ncbi:MAG: sigma-70 family RNA polymerase sigma factor [Clostridia bacterium]|nr:sigma-70 family RNA polymerase sigma factor [Clostridia bacterium]
MEDSAFELLVAQNQEKLLRTCYLYLRDRQLAEDAVQETFLKAYRSLPAFRGDSSEKTWLMRIAVNTCRDLYRSEWFRHMDRRVIPEELPESGMPFTSREESLIVEVMRLPRRLREATLLYYYHGMDEREIAEALGVSRSAVSDRLSRARRKLKELLEGRDEP